MPGLRVRFSHMSFPNRMDRFPPNVRHSPSEVSVGRHQPEQVGCGGLRLVPYFARNRRLAGLDEPCLASSIVKQLPKPICELKLIIEQPSACALAGIMVKFQVVENGV